MTVEHSLNQRIIKEFIASKQASLFHSLKESEFTGRVCFRESEHKQWFFYLYLGRLIYSTGGNHIVRRYKRNLTLFMPEMISDLAILERDPETHKLFEPKICWEYDLLSFWTNQGKINRKQVTSFIFAQTNEILFDLTQIKQLEVEYVLDKALSNPLTVIDSNNSVAEGWKLWQAWQNAKLADRSPDSAPLIIQPEQLMARTSEKTYLGMSKILDGKKSLRDLALVLNQNIVQFTSLLKPYIQMGFIELIEIDDHPPPIKPVVAPKFLVACVDDNPMVCQTMEKIVKGNGWDFLSVTDDLRAIALLLNHKPQMIFLDLIMPHINGYEICSKLRKMEAFAETPIIILSANTSLFDRLRGKMSGCSEFLAKPINQVSLIDLISKYQQAHVSNTEPV